MQPTSDVTAMWANDFRFSSHLSHLWTLLPIAKLAFSTLGL